jgi:hypothetical protein
MHCPHIPLRIAPRSGRSARRIGKLPPAHPSRKAYVRDQQIDLRRRLERTQTRWPVRCFDEIVASFG